MTVQIVLLGLGSIGMRHARNFLELGASVRGYDPSLNSRGPLEKAGGVYCSDRDALFKNADAVVIASPSAQHLNDLRQAVAMGLPALVEKPLAHDVEGVMNVLRDAETKNIGVSAALNLRHHPGVIALRDILKGGDCGRVLWARMWFSDYLPNWRPHQDYRQGYTASPTTGGILFDRIHEIDLANFLLGTGQVLGASARRSGQLDMASEDCADVLLSHPDGVVSNVHVDYCTRPRKSECEIATEQGRYLLDLDARTLVVFPADGGVESRQTFEGTYADDYLDEARHFLHVIAGQAEPLCKGSEALGVLSQVIAARRMCNLPLNREDEAGGANAPIERTRFEQSQALLARAKKIIPLASQTFSKSFQQYPSGASPLFVTHGQGGRIWDVDGNSFVDLVGGLFPLILGYRDADVDRAIRNQLDRGISFSLSTTLEAELAERLVDMIPSAEKVRFGKNGTDVTSAAIRLARAKTGRDRVAICGYHGWQDWSIAVTTRNKGIPGAVRELTHTFPYNDLKGLETLLQTHPGEFAAVMMEPMNVAQPAPGFLEGVRDAAHQHGAILVFDEIITGFRFANGGAQSLFGVTPDLSTFGKALGNGMPISAIVGRADIMDEMEQIFFSGTFGGETLSLAAAIAVLDKLRREPVIETIKARGKALADDVQEMIEAHGLNDALTLSGQPTCKFVVFKDHPAARKEVVRTLFQREMIRHGVLIINAHALSYAHDENCLNQARAAYSYALDVIADECAKGDVEARLDIPVIEPVFKVR